MVGAFHEAENITPIIALSYYNMILAELRVYATYMGHTHNAGTHFSDEHDIFPDLQRPSKDVEIHTTDTDLFNQFSNAC